MQAWYEDNTDGILTSVWCYFAQQQIHACGTAVLCTYSELLMFAYRLPFALVYVYIITPKG